MADEDDSVVRLEGEENDDVVTSPKLALYPIRLGGGGTGLYSDPREFGRGVMDGNLKFFQRCNNHNNNNDDEVDIEAQETLPQQQQQTKKRRSSTSFRSTIPTLDPWSLWTTFHNELSRLAALRTARLEDNSSHATLLRQKHYLTHRSNHHHHSREDDFDFVLVLSLNEAYAFWARYLDFRMEALGYEDDDDAADNIDNEESTIASLERDEWNTTTTPNNYNASNSGLRQRRRNVSSEKKTSSIIQGASSTPLLTPSFSHSASPVPRPSRSTKLSSQKRFQKSLFERAVDKFSPPRFSLGGSNNSPKPSFNTPLKSPEGKEAACYSTGNKLRRRWGNHHDGGEGSIHNLNFTSPPMMIPRSLKRTTRGGGGGGTGILSARKTNTWRSHSGTKGRRGTTMTVRSSLFESGGDRGSSKRGREMMLEGGGGGVGENEEDSFFASPGIPRGVGEYY